MEDRVQALESGRLRVKSQCHFLALGPRERCSIFGPRFSHWQMLLIFQGERVMGIHAYDRFTRELTPHGFPENAYAPFLAPCTGSSGSQSLSCPSPPQNCMNLPPDKVQLLSQYDNEKKWELICDQVGTRPLLASGCLALARLGLAGEGTLPREPAQRPV